MELKIFILAAVIGYLIGSISFARIIIRLVAPHADLAKVEEPVPNTDEVFVFRSISATSVRHYVGNRYGCLVSILDMAKAFFPVLIFRLIYPQQLYFLVVATAVIVGHNFPIFHAFKGGRGESPIIGSLLAIDPFGVVILNVIGILTGALLGNLMLMHWTGYLLMIPWLWWRTSDPWYVVFILLANLFYWSTLLPELGQYIHLIRTNQMPSQEAIGGFLGMGRGLGRFLDNYSIPALYKSWRNKSSTR